MQSCYDIHSESSYGLLYLYRDFFIRITIKGAYPSLYGVLILKEERTIGSNNVVGSNIRRIKKEKEIDKPWFVKMLQLNDVEIIRKTLVKIESVPQTYKIESVNCSKR